MDDQQPPPTFPPSRALTVSEVAALLRMNKKTVYGAIKRGELPHIRAGHSIRVLPSALFSMASADTEAQKAPSIRPNTRRRRRRR